MLISPCEKRRLGRTESSAGNWSDGHSRGGKASRRVTEGGGHEHDTKPVAGRHAPLQKKCGARRSDGNADEIDRGSWKAASGPARSRSRDRTTQPACSRIPSVCDGQYHPQREAHPRAPHANRLDLEEMQDERERVREEDQQHIAAVLPDRRVALREVVRIAAQRDCRAPCRATPRPGSGRARAPPRSRAAPRYRHPRSRLCPAAAHSMYRVKRPATAQRQHRDRGTRQRELQRRGLTQVTEHPQRQLLKARRGTGRPRVPAPAGSSAAGKPIRCKRSAAPAWRTRPASRSVDERSHAPSQGRCCLQRATCFGDSQNAR